MRRHGENNRLEAIVCARKGYPSYCRSVDVLRLTAEHEAARLSGQSQGRPAVAAIAEIADGLLRQHFNASEPHLEHEKYPYRLRELKIKRPSSGAGDGYHQHGGGRAPDVRDRHRGFYAAARWKHNENCGRPRNVWSTIPISINAWLNCILNENSFILFP